MRVGDHPLTANYQIPALFAAGLFFSLVLELLIKTKPFAPEIRKLLASRLPETPHNLLTVL
tara:strand:- start:401 stop:583 length:183 start_codon:yes stop_codon:yes gene_type:complete